MKSEVLILVPQFLYCFDYRSLNKAVKGWASGSAGIKIKHNKLHEVEVVGKFRRYFESLPLQNVC